MPRTSMQRKPKRIHTFIPTAHQKRNCVQTVDPRKMLIEKKGGVKILGQENK